MLRDYWADFSTFFSTFFSTGAYWTASYFTSSVFGGDLSTTFDMLLVTDFSTAGSSTTSGYWTREDFLSWTGVLDSETGDLASSTGDLLYWTGDFLYLTGDFIVL